MKRLKNITILLCFLSLLAFISCSAEDKTGGGIGVLATDLPNGYYQGNLQCKSCIIGNDFYADASYGANYKQELEQEYKDWFTVDPFYLKIANNKLKWSSLEDALEALGLEEVGALKSGSEYSATSLMEYDTTDSIVKNEATIKFTISGDTISITYISKGSQENKDGTLKFSVDATYEGTLTKYTPTTSSSS